MLSMAGAAGRGEKIAGDREQRYMRALCVGRRKTEPEGQSAQLYRPGDSPKGWLSHKPLKSKDSRLYSY